MVSVLIRVHPCSSVVNLFGFTLPPNAAARNCQPSERHARPAEDVAVAGVERGLMRWCGQWDGEGREAGAVDGALFIAEDVVQAALRINPAGEAVVAGAHERDAVLDGAEDGVGDVLPLLGPFTEPAAYAAEQDRLKRAYAAAYAAYFADHLPDNGVPCRFTVQVVDVPDRAASYEFYGTALYQRTLQRS